jgi:hypothetical protein
MGVKGDEIQQGANGNGRRECGEQDVAEGVIDLMPDCHRFLLL